MKRLLVVFFCFFIATLAEAELKYKTVFDLSYPFNEQTIYWPTAESFQHKMVSSGKTEAGFWYSSANYSASEHGGTHLDAPIHFAEGRWTNDQIPLENLIAPLLVIDISARTSGNPDYQATAEDILEWEKKNGKIPAGSIVLLRTGWGKYWPDKKKYLGDDKPGDASNLHFPAYSRAAAELLVQRKIKGAAIDTASLDPGNSKTFEAHRVFAGANTYGLENIANAEKLPVKGATMIALPMKIEKGTGGPARIIALIQ